MRIIPLSSYNVNHLYSSKNKNNPTFCAKGLFPGSFDPITNGHVDIIKRASLLFENLTILVSKNNSKLQTFLPEEIKLKFIETIIKEEKLKNVNVVCTKVFAAQFAGAEKDTFIVRGLRDNKDFDYEMSLLKTSRAINNEIDVIFLPTNEGLETLSSSAIKDLYLRGQDISSLVPKCVKDFLQK
jgi:pantetheine-phosphate adenylyltransferase